MYTVMGFSIVKPINDWLSSVAGSVMDFAVSGAKAILDQVTQNLPVITTWYNVFLAIAVSMVVSITLFRVIHTLLSNVDDSSDVTWINILMDSTKGAFLIPIMVFIQGFLQKKIVIPMAQGMFSMDSNYTSKAVQGVKDIPLANGSQKLALNGSMQVLFLVFFAIVTIAFLIKMCIYFADMAWYNLAVPFAAISIATESFDYSTMWWKKLVYYNISMLSQVLSLTLTIWCFTNLANYGFIAFMGCIGFGWLVLHTPHVIQDFWASTGITKSGGRSAIRGLQNGMRRLSSAR